MGANSPTPLCSGTALGEARMVVLLGEKPELVALKNVPGLPWAACAGSGEEQCWWVQEVESLLQHPGAS